MSRVPVLLFTRSCLLSACNHRYHGWTTSRHYVSSVRVAPSNALMFSNPSDRPIGFWTGRSSEGGQRYYVENAEILLDGAGEFFVRPTGEVLYRPMPGEVSADGKSLTLTAWMPRVERLLSVSGTCAPPLNVLLYSAISAALCSTLHLGIGYRGPNPFL